jgi:hypothetical protein
MASVLRLRTTGVLFALALLPRCACDTVPSDAIERCEASAVIPGAVATDILFVIDDSGSMSQEQDNLAANLGAFLDTLVASPIQNDFQIGVTTTAVEGFDSTTSFTSGPESGNPYPAGALVADDPASTTAGDLVYDLAAYPSSGGWGGLRILSRGAPAADVDAFKQSFRVGTSGSAKEQPFRAARLALSDRIADGTNAGFLRPGARLAVIFVTDEDDCSDSEPPFTRTTVADGNADCHDPTFKQTDLDPVEGLAAFLLGPVGGEIRDVVVGAIVWPPGTSCPSPAQAFDPADRFGWLADAIGAARMRTGHICDPSFRDTLVAFAEVLKPSSLPLEGAPADHRMLVVAITKPDGTRVDCTVAAEGTPEQATADAVYSAPRLGRPAMLTFQPGRACELDLGDRIDVRVVCAG